MAQESKKLDYSIQISPDEIARRRQVAENLNKSIAQNRAQDWAGVAANWATGIVAGINSWRASQAETAGMQSAQSDIDSYENSVSDTAPTTGLTSAQQVSAAMSKAQQPTAVDPTASQIKEGLLKRGVADHVADGVLANFKSESGLKTDINEKNPTVEGSRGGYGLAQWTGDRRKGLEAFAAGQGKPASDLDVQLDYFMKENQGAEKAAWDKVSSAPDAASAAQAFVKHWERPAEQHLNARLNQYAKGVPTYDVNGNPLSDEQVAALDKRMGVPVESGAPAPALPEAKEVSARPIVEGFAKVEPAPAPVVPGSQDTVQKDPKTGQEVRINAETGKPYSAEAIAAHDQMWGGILGPDGAPVQAPKPGLPATPQQMAVGAAQDATLKAQDQMQKLRKVMSNPFLTKNQAAVYGAEFDKLSKQADPEYQLNMQMKQMQLEQMQKQMSAGDKYKSDADLGNGIVRQVNGDGQYRYIDTMTNEAVTKDDPRLAPKASDGWKTDKVLDSGNVVQTNAKGEVRTVGPDGKAIDATAAQQVGDKGGFKPGYKASESEAKNSGYFEGAVDGLDALKRVGAISPTGMMAPNALKGEKEQLATSAYRMVISQILRSESGGAITSDEVDNAMKTYVPQVGDSEEVKKQKFDFLSNKVNSLYNAAGGQNYVPRQRGATAAPAADTSSKWKVTKID